MGAPEENGAGLDCAGCLTGVGELRRGGDRTGDGMSGLVILIVPVEVRLEAIETAAEALADNGDGILGAVEPVRGSSGDSSFEGNATFGAFPGEPVRASGLGTREGRRWLAGGVGSADCGGGAEGGPGLFPRCKGPVEGARGGGCTGVGGTGWEGAGVGGPLLPAMSFWYFC